MSLSFPFIAGLIAAMLHVITGPDHLAAVVPFAIEAKRKAWKIGLAWGIGHLVSMLAIGIVFVIFKELIPIETISAYSEQLVALVLIGIGLWAFYRIAQKNKRHDHLHIHTENSPVIHAHKHEHTHRKDHAHTHEKSVKQSNISALGVGVLHGTAGVAHFLLFLPVLAFEEQYDAVYYVVGFGIGTVLAMTAFAWVIGRVSSFAKNGHNDVFFNGIRFAGGLFAVCIGIYWLFQS